MALKSAIMAGLDVQEVTMRKAQNYLEKVCGDSTDEGYSYLPGDKINHTMTSVALLCRQYLQAWGPQNLRMIKAVDNHIKKNDPTPRDMYYTYYATQVMHHFGGQSWKDWNDKMRAGLLKEQDKTSETMKGSWTAVAGNNHIEKTGGRLMQTSLCLLTLEVYYRYLPLYQRAAGEQKVEMQK